jgi:hypothetical protein
MRWIAIVALVIGLAGCGAEPRYRDPSALEVYAADALASDAAAAAPAGEANRATPSEGSRREIAYTYKFEVWLRANAVEGLQKQHMDACQKAGAAACQIVNSDIRREGNDRVYASLEMRMRPADVSNFRTELEKVLPGLDGELRSAAIQAEDLTRQIIDLEARLKAQTTLRDRLQQLIAERPGKLADLLETERELARVQQELDSATSMMAVFRERVDLSMVSITYEARPVSVADRTFEPITRALRGALSVMVDSIAGLITLLAGLLPIILVFGGIIWFIVRRWRRRRAKPAS